MAREASRWLGEAEAVAADLARDSDITPSVADDRLREIESLLEQIQAIEDPIAAHHVGLTSRLVRRVLSLTVEE